MDRRISATEAARLIGVRTQTLAKWRCQKKGPPGWVRVSATHVTYPLSAIEQFLADCAAGAKRKQ